MIARIAGSCGVVCALACAAPVQAQDFASAFPVAAAVDALSALECALPPSAPSVTATVVHTRWWDLRELQTRAVALGAGWHGVRAAVGLSQTGEPELGWTTLACSLGAAGPEAGAALRGCARADRDAPWQAGRWWARTSGIEAGAGAWLAPVPGVRVWATAPQVVARGASPPLARALEVGVRAGRESQVWCALRAPRASDDGERALGILLALAPLAVWGEVRDTPLRAAAGVRASAAALHVDVRVDAHPVLGETVRVALLWQRSAEGLP